VEPLSTDDDLLRELSAALAEADVPPAVRAEGYAAWTWRDIDSELASLVYDSAVDPRLSALTRAIAAPRTLVFRTDDLAVELELAGRALVGQVVPPGPGEVELLSPAGETRSTPVDGAGRFEIGAAPTGLLRLRCRAAGGAALSTGWMHLSD